MSQISSKWSPMLRWLAAFLSLLKQVCPPAQRSSCCMLPGDECSARDYHAGCHLTSKAWCHLAICTTKFANLRRPAQYQDLYLPYPFRMREKLCKNKWAGHPAPCLQRCSIMHACELMMAANYSPTGRPLRERSRLPQRKRLLSEPQPVPASAPDVMRRTKL